MTRLLTRSTLEALLEPDAAIEALQDGFAQDHQPSIPGRRVRTDLPGPGTATALLPGLLPGIGAYTVKVNAKFPNARPASRGVVCLHDLRDGSLLALLDSATITAWRTGLAAALATHLLATATATKIGIIGAGVQAQHVLRGLTRLRTIDRVTITDLDPTAAERLAARLRDAGQPADVAGDAATVAAASDIIVLATWSRSPVLALADVGPGRHLTSLAADEPGKQELAPDLLSAATLIVDDRALVTTAGALATAGLPVETAAATLGEVLRGQHPGRTQRHETTAYTPVGLPWQDLALAWTCYQQAEQHNLGRQIDLLA